ncbi:MAG TPA: DHA2 family efflux MFS transporter permease subunit [Spongiibacteraceae bacterium]|nr:DHA2 family efflux MFS transporter permease subunit [Spongiibacteraceae bacterium]
MPAQAALLRNRFWVTIAVTLTALMQTLDSTIANVALPHIQGSMAATQDEISWVLTSYILAAAIMTPPSAFLANRFGRKNVLVACAAGFILASALCGAATSLIQIVCFRFLQGAFGAPLMPIIQAVLLDLYTDKERGKSMAIFGFGVMFGPIIGPTLGGLLTDFYNWRWVFYINLPLGALALAGMIFFMQESVRETERSFDFFGFGLLSITVAALQLALDRGQSQNWFSSTEIICELMASGLCFYLFLVHTFTAEHPFVEPDMFRDRNFVAGLIFNFFAASTLMGTMALMPIFLQTLLGIPVLTAGILMAPRGIGTLLSMLVIPRLANIVDPRWLLLIGIVVTGLAMGEMAHFTLDIDTRTIIRTGFVQGIGLGFTMVPISILLFSTLDRRYRTEASMMYNLLRNLGGSLFISLVVTLLAQNSQVYHAQLTEAITPFQDTLPSIWDWRSSAGAMALNGEVTRQASGIAYFNDFALMQWLALGTIPLLLLFRKAKIKPVSDEEKAVHLE